MKVELQVVSPEVKLIGIDNALGKLDQLEGTLQRLAALKNVNFQVKVSTPGIDKLRADMAGLQANAKGLEAALRTAGKNDLADQVASGALPAKEALAAIGREAQMMGDKLTVAQRHTQELWQQFGRLQQQRFGFVGEADHTEADLQKLREREKAEQAYMARYASLQQAQGIAQAMASGPIKETAAAEEKLAGAQTEAMAGMKQQAALAEMKARMMGKLRQEVGATAAEEHKLDAALQQSGKSMETSTARGVLLSQTHLRAKDAGEEHVKSTYGLGPGEKLEVNEKTGLEKRTVTEMDKVRLAVAAAEREGEEGMAKATGDWEKLLAVEKKAQLIRASLADTKLQDDPFVQSKLRSAAALETRAEGMAQTQGMRSQRQGEMEQMEKFKQSVAATERQADEAIARATNDWERLLAVEQKARNIRATVATAPDQNDTFVQNKLRSATALEMRAEEMARSQAVQGQREGELKQLDRYRQMSHDIRATAKEERSEGRGGTQAESYRNEAQALDNLRNSLQLGTRESAAFARTLEMQAVTLRASATETERTAAARAQMAEQSIRDFQQTGRQWGGVTRRKITESEQGTRETSNVGRESNGLRETVHLVADYDHAGQALNATLSHTSEKVEALERTTRGYGRTLLNGIGSFAGFVVASSAVYGAVELLHHGFASFADIERQTAVLKTVFRGTEDQALHLRDVILGLAVSYGRSADEAMDAAVRWARIGLSTQQTAEAVAISLQAANIAQVTAAQAAEQLSAIYATFGLTIGEVRVALNEMDRISHSVNVTVTELMAGMARVSGIAHQVGLSVVETMGLIAGTVSRTGRSGSEAGNALKAMISAISKPEMQSFLKTGFQLDVKTETGDIQQFNTILSELFVTYQRLTDAERQELLVKLGGKQQASRFAAILDGYVASQRLAIEAQLDMNRADKENANIRQKIMSQVGSMGAMFQKLSEDMATAGGKASLGANLTEFVKLLTHAMEVMDKAPILMVLLGAVTLTLAGRMLLAASAMGEGATKANYLTGTLEQLKAVYGTLGEAVTQANSRLVIQDGLLGRLAARSLGVSGRAAAMRSGVAAGMMTPDMAEMAMKQSVGQASAAGKAMAFIIGAIPALLKFTIVTALISAAMYGVNKVFEHFEADAEKARRKLAGFNDEMERLKNVSRANEMRQRLAGTMEASIGTIAQRSPDAARRALENFAVSASPTDARGADAIRQELQGLLEQNRMEELQARIGQMKLGMQKEQEQSKLRELGASRKQKDELDGMLSKEKQSLQALSGDAREEASKRVHELETRIAEQLGRQAEIQGDIIDLEDQHDAQGEDRAKRFKDAAKAKVETTNKISEAMPKLDGPLASYERESEANEINLRQTRERIRLLTEERAAATKARDDASSEAQQKVDALQNVVLNRQEGVDRASTGFSFRDSQWGTLAEVNPNLDASSPANTLDPGDPRTMEATSSLREQQRNRDAGLAQVAGSAEQSKGMGYDSLKALDWDYQQRVKILGAINEQGLAEQNNFEQRTKSEKDLLKELEDRKRMIEMEKESVQIRQQIKEGQRDAKGLGDRNRIGRNDSEKDISEFTALDPFASSNIDSSKWAAAMSGQKEVMSKRESSELDWRDVAEKMRPEGYTGAADPKMEGDRAELARKLAVFQMQKMGMNEPAIGPEGESIDPAMQASALDRPLDQGTLGALGAHQGHKQETVFEKKPAAEEQAQVMAQVQRMEELLNGAIERRNHLMAETVNLRRQEAEEASKALMTASREDQLRAAATAKFVSKRGGKGFSGSEFEFLDHASQEAITRFNPQAAPRELQSPAVKAEAEGRLLDSSIGGMKEVLDRTKSLIEAFMKPVEAPGNTEAGRPAAPQANPTINVSMGDQFGGLVDKLVAVVQQDIQRVEAKVDHFLTGESRTIASAQSASQSIS